MWRGGTRSASQRPAELRTTVFLIVFLSARRLYVKRRWPSKLMRCSKRASRVARQRQAVVLFAISTKSCGQVCGLSLYSAAARSCRAYRVGRDQKLSSVLSCENMRLPERIGLGSGSRRAGGGLPPHVDRVGSAPAPRPPCGMNSPDPFSTFRNCCEPVD